MALQCRDEGLTDRGVKHHRAEARRPGERRVVVELLHQFVEDPQEAAADETDEEVLLRRPVEVHGALPDMGARRHIGDGEAFRAATEQQIVGGGEKPRRRR